MLKCKEVTTIITSDELKESSWMKRLSVRMHLFMCKHCRRYSSQIRIIGRVARELFGPGSQAENPERISRLEKTVLQAIPSKPKNNPPSRSE